MAAVHFFASASVQSVFGGTLGGTISGSIAEFVGNAKELYDAFEFLKLPGAGYADPQDIVTNHAGQWLGRDVANRLIDLSTIRLSDYTMIPRWP